MGRHPLFKNLPNAQYYNPLEIKKVPKPITKSAKPKEGEEFSKFKDFGSKLDDIFSINKHCKSKHITSYPPSPTLWKEYDELQEEIRGQEEIRMQDEIRKIEIIPSPELFPPLIPNAKSLKEVSSQPILPHTQYSYNIFDSSARKDNCVDPNAVVHIIELGNSPIGHDE